MPITMKTGPTALGVMKSMTVLRPWLSEAQYLTLLKLCRPATEEHEHFWQIVTDLAKRIQTMPQTYQTDGQGDQALVYLHYFKGAGDWHITEKDSDPDGEGQVQAFGRANIGFGGEMGYISIVELTQNNVELDLYWTPKPLSAVKE